MEIRLILYVVGCLFLPGLWGWGMHRVFTRLRLDRYLPTVTWSEPHDKLIRHLAPFGFFD